MLQVWLLGQFEVRVDGKRANIASRAAQSLLAYLILSSSTPHRREKLAGLLWPEMSDDNARNNLRHELWRVRKAITAPQADAAQTAEREYILAEDLTIGFNSDANYWLDVAQLEKASADPQALISGLSLYRGELLPGFYDDWVSLERERVQAIFEGKTQQLLKLLIAEQRWQTVLEWAERWIGLGQTPEPAYRALMLGYAALGDNAKVAETYERCVAALDKELGVEPAPETQSQYDELMRGDRVALVNLSARQYGVKRTLALPAAPPAPGEPPFKGLQCFDVSDAALFFGREELVSKLVGELNTKRFLAVVVGASGSGKSSVVRAGIIPALKSNEGQWRVYILTPTAHPLEALALELTRDSESVTATATLLDDLNKDPRALHLWLRRQSRNEPELSGRVLLAIDQFEELFTLCRDEVEREMFIDALLTASAPYSSPNGGGIADPSSNVTLILTIRADFYAHLAQYPELREAVAKQQEYIGPMTSQELRRAIEEPAKRGAADGAAWEFEPGLVDLMLRDVGDEPGALPLLSHALLETWKRRSGHVMTLKGYADAGGVRGAIAHTAETTYQQLSPEEQDIARNVFLRLTELGDATEDTRRRASFAELVPQGDAGLATRDVLTQLADARLITTGRDTAEVAHEALIREWPRLREWLNQDREGLRLHRQLTEAAQEWELLERDSGALYRGARLAQGLEWATLHGNELNAHERAFLEASQAQQKHEEREKEAQQQRELDSAKRIAESAQTLAAEQQARAEESNRANRRLRRRALFLVGAFVLAMLLAGLALVFSNQARTNAAVAQANAAQAESERRIATARELAASAVSNLTIDPERSVLLALQAIQKTDAVDHTILPEAVDSLRRAFQALRIELTLRGHTDTVWSAVFSPDGTRIATASADGKVKIWDATAGKELLSIDAANGTVWYAAFSPNGKLLATAGSDKLAHIWDATTGKELQTLASHKDEVYHIEFSPDSSRVATVSPDGTAKLWDVSTGKVLLTLNQGEGARPYWVTFSPDGSRIAVANTADDSVGWASIWDAGTGKELVTLPRQAGYVNSVAFSPDGAHIVTTSEDQTARIWDSTTGKELLTLYSQTASIANAAYSPDGKNIATAKGDRHIIIWDAFTGQELLSVPAHNGDILTVAYSPDGTRLVTASRDQTAKVWSVGPSREYRTFINGPAIASAVGAKLAYSPDGNRLAVAYSDPIAKIWNMTTGKLQSSLTGHTDGVSFVAYNSDGSRLATAARDGTAKVWDAVSGKELLTVSLPTDFGTGVAFSPDGTRLGTTSLDPVAQVWDAETGRLLLNLTGHGDALSGITFSPDGSRIATSSWDSTAIIWDAVTGKQIFSLVGHKDVVRQVIFSPDGTRLATAGLEGIAKVWDAVSGKELFTLSGHTGSVFDVAYSRDGKYLATASGDKTAKIWDAVTGEELQTLYAEDGLTGIAFSPDGAQLATASRDGTNRIYLLKLEDLMTLAKQRVTRALTTEECHQYLHVSTCPTQP